MEEKEEGGISLKEIFSTIFSQKWIALAIVFVVTVAGTLGIYFGKNYLSRSYDVSFTLELPQTRVKDDSAAASSSVVYPDETPFYYTDIVSLTTLRNVKKTSTAFDNIDIERMSKNGDISISRSVNETANNSGTYESIYSLSVKAKYFPSKDVAHDFVVALTGTPMSSSHLSLNDIDYNVYLNAAKAAPDYDTEISQLIAQANYLVGRYETFIDIYNDVSIGGQQLLYFSEDIKSYTTELEYLLTEVKEKGYLKSEDAIGRYQSKLSMIERQLVEEELILESLSKLTDGTAVAEQARIVAQLKTQKADLEKFLSEENRNNYGENIPKSFSDKLDDAYKHVQKYTDDYKTVISSLYRKVSIVSYFDSNVIVTNGDTGIITSAIISFVVGVILSMIIAYVVGWSKRRKAASAAQQTSFETPDTDTQTDNQ